jgi:Cu(I)/Ag(I) efflux system membrane protein CusA/SilA
MAAAALLSVTLVPVLMLLFIRGRIMPEQKNPLNRLLLFLYRPVIRWVLRFKRSVIVLAMAAVAVSIIPAQQVGSEFMPTLYEGSLLYMPTTLPGLSMGKAEELLQTQDKIIRSFPEVASVYGKAGRAATATDPAPTEMFETIINLKPEADWRPGMTQERLVAEMDTALQMPGVNNAWTMPLKARIDMLSTGIRTPVGIKLFGPRLEVLEPLAQRIEAVVRQVPGTASAYAERTGGGYYLTIDPDRTALARYGLTIDDLQEVILTALGGETVTTVVDGRERFAVTVRYPRDLRSDPDAIARHVLVNTASGTQLPLGQLASIRLEPGPAVIRTEDALLSVYLFVDIRDRDLGSYVADAQRAVQEQVQLPAGTRIQWSGQFESMERAWQRLQWVIPLTVCLIFLLLYIQFRRLAETLIVMLSLPFAWIGGIWLLYALEFNFSVAVAVGFIALAGVAAETGVIMLVYLDHALDAWRHRRQQEGLTLTRQDIHAAIMEGAVERVRPKIMTVVAIMAGLLPILWSTGTGAEIMRRIAVPMIGGMLSSTLLTLIIIPALYAWVKERRV